MTASSDQVSNRAPYQAKQSRWWWLRNRFYTWYMVREGTALFVLMYCLILMTGLLRLSQGEAAWNGWLETLRHPAYILFHVCALLAALYHTVTWFRLAPKIMVVRIGDWRLPEQAMLVGQWIAFFVCTALLLTIALTVGV